MAELSVGVAEASGAAAVSLAPDADSAGVEASALVDPWSVGSAASCVDGLAWAVGVASEDGSEEAAEEVCWLSAEEAEGLDVVSADDAKGSGCVLPLEVLVLCSSAICVAFHG